MQLKFVNMIGIVAATAFSIGFIIIDAVDAALWGLSGAPAIMIKQNLGAGNSKRAREVALKAMLLIFILVAIGAAVAYPIRRNIADVFANDKNILDETNIFPSNDSTNTSLLQSLFSRPIYWKRVRHTLFPTTLGILRLWGV